MKKLNLFLSICMMCLSITILCFGVISASSVEYSISGVITYDAPNLNVKVTTTTYGVPGYNTNEVCAMIHLYHGCDELKVETIKTMMGEQWDAMTDEDKNQMLSELGGDDLLAELEDGTLREYYGEYGTYLAQVYSSEWTPSSSSNVTQIPINYGDPETETGKYWIYITIINVQNLNSAQPVKAELVDTTDTTGGDKRNSLIWQTTDTLNYITTTDNKVETMSDGAEVSTSNRNLVLIYSVKDLYEKVENVSFSYDVKITEDNDESLGTQKTLLADTDNSYYYVNLGTMLSGTKKTNRKWRLVSLDGLTQYSSFSADSLPTLVPGKSRFVQESISSMEMYTFNDTGSDNNYFTSTIRQSVRTGEYLGLTESDISDFIEAVDLGSICYYMRNSDYSYSVDTGATSITKDSTDTTKDYFYLMSYEEADTFLSTFTWYYEDNSERGVYYFLRNPYSRLSSDKDIGSSSVIFVNGYGSHSLGTAGVNEDRTCSIRAMFTLSSSYTA